MTEVESSIVDVAARKSVGVGRTRGHALSIDRNQTAKALGFDGPMRSLDAVADRDFAVEFVAAASLAMIHLSRLSEELVVWSSKI